MDKLIGNTPLIRWGKFEEATIWVKDEGRNLTGSLKDRHAKAIIDDLESSGQLKGKELLDASSGSFAVSLVMQAVLRGIPATITVNSKISAENLAFIESFQDSGIRVIQHGKVTKDGYDYCLQIMKEEPDRYIFTDQLNNPTATQAHQSTAAEILQELPNVTAVVASIGSGATILGMHRHFEQSNKSVRLFGCVGVQGDVAKFPGTYVVGADFETPFIRELDERKLVTYVPVGFVPGIDAVKKYLLPKGVLGGRQGGGVFLGTLEAVTKYGLCGDVAVVIGDSYWKNSSALAALSK